MKQRPEQTAPASAYLVTLLVLLMVAAALSLAGSPFAVTEPLPYLHIFLTPVVALFAYSVVPLRRGLHSALKAFARWRFAGPLTLAVAIGAGLWLAIDIMWCADDAFISFTYSQHFAEGHGLIFNIGERVEGYTNFLWTVMIAGAMWLGIPGPETAIVLNLAFMAGTLVVVYAIVRRVDPLKEAGVPSFPLSPLMLALVPVFNVFSTSGLETIMAAFFVVLGLYWWISRPNGTGAFLSGLSLIAATLSRPDQALFYIAMGCTLLLPLLDSRSRDWKATLRHIALFALPFVVVYVPYFLWRYNYYGFLLPNTFYAKNGGGFSMTAGLSYIKDFVVDDGLWLLVPYALFFMFVRSKSRAMLRLSFFCGLSIVLILLYIMKVGGDFMHGRFFMSVLPLFFLLLELGGKHWLARRLKDRATRPSGWLGPWLRAAAGMLLVLVLVFVFFKPEPQGKVVTGEALIANEQKWYQVTTFHPMEVDSYHYRSGKVLDAAFAPIQEKPLYAAFCVGMQSFYSRMPMLDCFGLTNSHIAHQPFTGKRKRPGHERTISPAYMQQRSPWLFAPYPNMFPLPVPYEEYQDVQALYLDGELFYMSRWEPELLAQIDANPKVTVEYARFPQYIERYLEHNAPVLSPQQLQKDIAFFKYYYFDHEDNPALLKRLHRAQNTTRLTRPL